MKNAEAARMMAMRWHQDQRRKYTGDLYAQHLAEVAGLAATAVYSPDVDPQDVIATAWLHDIVEDQGCCRETLEVHFGHTVADGVMLLSDLEAGNRAERKELARERLKLAPGWVQSIKCADLISNTPSIAIHDTKFFEVYSEEALRLLGVLDSADPGLRDLAYQTIRRFDL